MSETRIQAFERMAQEMLDTPELSIQFHEDPSAMVSGSFTGGFSASTYDESAKVNVKHHGPIDDLKDLEEQHDDAFMQWGESQTSVGGELLITTAEFIIPGDPHGEYGTGGSSGSVSGPPPTPSAASGSSTEAESDDEQAETATSYPDPSHDITGEIEGGPLHVLTEATTAEDIETVCGADLGMAAGKIQDEYDSLIDFAADPEVCEECAGVVIRHYNLPEQDVRQHAEEVYDG